MAKIVINTTYESAGSKVCVDDLIPRLTKAGHQVTNNDWHNYSRYDIALFMSPDSQIREAKRQNQNIITGILLAMVGTRRRIEEIQAADFVLVGSIEQREALLPYNKNIVIYYMFPDIQPRHKRHAKKKPIIIGYHGNKEHLGQFYPTITKALERLAVEHSIKLLAMYNIENYGQWQRGLPSDVEVTHVQWSPQNYYRHLAQCDIGIVNNTIPMQPSLVKQTAQAVTNSEFIHKALTGKVAQQIGLTRYITNPRDHIVRFKYPANPNRIYVFAQFGIPVIADFNPSSSQIILDGERGFIVQTADGWYWALKKLVESPPLRQRFSYNLRSFIDENMSIDKNFTQLNKFLIKLVNAQSH